MVQNPLLFLFAFATLLGTIVIIAATTIVVTGGDDLGPDNACRNELTGETRPVSREVTSAERFQVVWDQVRQQLDAGQTEVRITLDESQVTSRASQYMNERDAPLDDIIICFHDGFAEARATVDTPGVGDVPIIGAAFKVDARVTGTLDVTGAYPKLAVASFEATRVPGLVEDAIRDNVEEAINSRLDDLALSYNYDLLFTEGTAIVTASQRPPPTLE